MASTRSKVAKNNEKLHPGLGSGRSKPKPKRKSRAKCKSHVNVKVHRRRCPVRK